ncbi:MAG TPA: HlyC/CorC family transporter [Steroidobacteraceae bacterium]|nr:HlyC/CorC family transporter [Steroidobacteraceae bacterium]
MRDIPLPWLIGVLVACIALSAFFSSTETALMAVNRYRLRHLARGGSVGARAAEQLLGTPDRLIGVILLCNNFVNSAAAAIVTVISLDLGGEGYAAIGVGAFTVTLIIFGEVAPKTFGALYPERLALPAALVYQVLLKLFYPVVWAVNLVANAVLRLGGISREKVNSTSLSQDELRTVLAEAATVIPHRHQRMLMSILDLERVNVEDIMVPRNEIAGIDASDEWDDILDQLRDIRHTRIPVYDGTLEHLVGILHMKKVARMLARGEFAREQLVALARTREPYYVPEGTSLNRQLLNFQRQRRRVAFVVDEYGDIQGLVTIEDLLEEIVGEFTTDTSALHKDVHKERGGTFVVNASASVRTLNRKMGWTLPTTGPRTLNGLIIEYLETIPDAGTSLRIDNYSIDVLQTGDNAVKTVRLKPIVSPASAAAADGSRPGHA